MVKSKAWKVCYEAAKGNGTPVEGAFQNSADIHVVKKKKKKKKTKTNDLESGKSPNSSFSNVSEVNVMLSPVLSCSTKKCNVRTGDNTDLGNDNNSSYSTIVSSDVSGTQDHKLSKIGKRRKKWKSSVRDISCGTAHKEGRGKNNSDVIPSSQISSQAHYFNDSYEQFLKERSSHNKSSNGDSIYSSVSSLVNSSDVDTSCGAAVANRIGRVSLSDISSKKRRKLQNISPTKNENNIERERTRSAEERLREEELHDNINKNSCSLYVSEIRNNSVIGGKSVDVLEKSTSCISPTKKKKKRNVIVSPFSGKMMENTLFSSSEDIFSSQTNSSKEINTSISEAPGSAGSSASPSDRKRKRKRSKLKQEIDENSEKTNDNNENSLDCTLNSSSVDSVDISLSSFNEIRKKKKKKQKKIKMLCNDDSQGEVEISSCYKIAHNLEKRKNILSECQESDINNTPKIVALEDTPNSAKTICELRRDTSNPRKNKIQYQVSRNAVKSSDIDFENTLVSQKSTETSTMLQKSVHEISDFDSLFNNTYDFSFGIEMSGDDEEEEEDEEQERSRIKCESIVIQGMVNMYENNSEDLQDIFIDVNHEVPPLHWASMSPYAPPKKEDIERLIQLGMKKGSFSKSEDTIIMANWEKFTERYGPLDPCLFLFCKRKYINVQVEFYQFLGNGVPNRSLHQIYKRFLHLSLYSKKGPFTTEEDELILYAKKMNISCPYKVLSCIMKRSRHSVYERYTLLKDSTSGKNKEKQKWTISLAESVVKALFEILKTSSLDDLREAKISSSMWREVGKIVGISHRKLRQFWSYRLYTQLFATSPLCLKDIFRKIIKWLRKKKPVAMQDIDWSESTSLVSGATPWFMWEMFRCMRKAYKEKEFRTLQDFIEALHKNKELFEKKERYFCRYKLEEGNFLSVIDDS